MFVLVRNGIVGPRLRDALQWWSRVLRLEISETREWQHVDNGACHLFVDAASSPARCAAVLFHSGGIAYTDAAPNDAIWAMLKDRRDKQITGLEIWAIALGLPSFQQQIMGKTVFLYSDNTGMSPRHVVGFPTSVRYCFVLTGAELGTVKGSAKAFDHNALIHNVWMQALVQRFELWVYRVPTDDNLSDLPSRGEYALLHEMGAVWQEPCIAQMYLEAASSRFSG